jgi:hypothetical protein
MTKLTTSEARAEAVTIALQVLMRKRMTGREREEAFVLAMREGVNLGRADILEELTWLFATDDGEVTSADPELGRRMSR